MTARAPWSSGLSRRLSLAPAFAALVLSACSSESNQAPVATPQEVAAAQDVPLHVLLAGADPDGDALSFSVVSPPAHGTLSGTAPALTYTPEPGYSGSDAFTFTASDGETASDATVSVTVVPAAGPVVPGAAALDAALARVVATTRMRGGLSIALAKHGTLLFARAYGRADAAHGVTFEPTALARIASCSKTITAATVMRLAEQGLLSLDAKVFDVLTEYPLPAGADPRLSGMTIRHLLAHTAGFDPSGDPLITDQVRMAEYAGVPSPPTCGQIFGLFRSVSLGYTPGTRWVYSNLGYCALSLVVEHVTGRSYQDAVRTGVFSSMGIRDARFGGTRLADRAPGEVVYESGASTGTSVFPEDGGAVVPWAYGAASIPTSAGSAAWIASAVDLTRFLDAMRGHGGSAFLSAESLAAMETPNPLASGVAPPDLFPGWTMGYGLGMHVLDGAGGARWSGHAGNIPGSGCEMWSNADGWSWAALWNETTDIYGGVWQSVLAAIDPSFTGSPTDLYPFFPSPELGPYLGQ